VRITVEPNPIAIKIDEYSNKEKRGLSSGSPRTTFPYFVNEKNKPAATRMSVYQIYPHLKFATIESKIVFITSSDFSSASAKGILKIIIIINDGINIR